MSTSKMINGVPVQEHFKDAFHQFDSAKMGIWLFMVTEILMFGGLFVGYAIFHMKYPEMFAEGARFLDWKLGFVNTLVLIFSSFTMALGIYYNQINQPGHPRGARRSTLPWSCRRRSGSKEGMGLL